MPHFDNNKNVRINYSESSYGQSDAFGRQRVAEPQTLFSGKLLYTKMPLFWSEATSGGAETSTHSTADSSVTMTTSNSGEYVIRQTKMRFDYQSGKSQQILITGLMSTEENITKRIGYFNSSIVSPYTASFDGIYFENDGTGLNVVQSKSGTATSVAQNDFNLDKLDGTGWSKVTLDISKTQIFIIDFEWLGVGRVRVGFVIDGDIIYCHEFRNANTITSTYITSPNHSIRYEIRQTGVGSGSLVQICSSVSSEGGAEETGIIRTEGTNYTHVDANTADTNYPLVAIRLKSTHLDDTIVIQSVALLTETATPYRWFLTLNPTVTGDAFVFSDVADSAIQIARPTNATTISDANMGTITNQGYGAASAQTRDAITTIIKTTLRPGAALDGTADIIVLGVTPLSANADIQGSITWREANC